MSISDKGGESNKQFFTLVGMRTSSENSENEGNLELNIVGTFIDEEQANIARDIYSDLDTTMNFLTVVPCLVRDSIPDVYVMIYVYVNEEGEVIAESRCSFTDDEPWLKSTKEEFKSLAWPEDEESIISEAIKWSENKFGSSASVIRQVSPKISEYI